MLLIGEPQPATLIFSLQLKGSQGRHPEKFEHAAPVWYDLLNAAMLMVACKCAGPTVATVGLSMQVPFAVIMDAIFKHPAWLSSASSAALTFIGATLVLTGFFGINVTSAKADEELPTSVQH